MLYHGDLFDVLPTLEANSLDSCVTDPPYGLEFMGKSWDTLRDVQGWHEAWAREVYRVLKPGAYLCAFGGTRTFHRLTCGLEDAGFEIRDCLMWLYGTGFPKSLDVSKAIDKRLGVEREVVGPGQWVHVRGVQRGASQGASNGGEQGGYNMHGAPDETAPATDAAKLWVGYGTALKPGWEPIVLCRKPLQGTVAQNVLTHGTGALNIDGCRIGTSKRAPASPSQHADTLCHGKYGAEDGTASGFNTEIGRWPANVVLDEIAAQHLDAQSETHSAGAARDGGQSEQTGAGGVFGMGHHAGNGVRFGDDGGASRFFTVVPEGRWPANVVLDEQAAQQLDAQSGACAAGSAVSGEEPSHTGVNTYGEYGRVPFVPHDDAGGASRFFYIAKPDKREREAGGGTNSHPTVKPVELMRWLVRLITPPQGTCLDPFMGSGTTGMACRAEMREVVGIERDASYVQIAERRMADVAPLFHETPTAVTAAVQSRLFEEPE